METGGQIKKITAKIKHINKPQNVVQEMFWSQTSIFVRRAVLAVLWLLV